MIRHDICRKMVLLHDGEDRMTLGQLKIPMVNGNIAIIYK